ncbi:MAG: TIGR00266 family protein [Nitrosopumilus sp.]|nr:TIGR00266 family protein [Nitrosopumilus sp.]MDH3736567.1 TIGR00266 family protein [Nitrosopumilus sp.]MDH3823688.1 TIGR00266 family protein [Nitrosopumilus sp.]MDH3834311.1 TIGR00266 family protein [Nitrosopumilus sp.]
MEYEIVKNPMGLIQFTMNKGEKITAEAAAMVFIKGNIETETRMRKGGFLKSLKAAALGGESFFVNEFIAQEDNCKLGLTGNMLGDIEVISVNEEFIVQSGSFVGSTSGLTLDTKWQGFTKGIFGSNLFMLKTVGTGDMFVNGWGGIVSTKLELGEKMILDNYQLVALSSTADYRVTKHGSFKTTLFGGEALVIEITGPGTVYFQTKNLMEFVRALIPFLPKSRH